MIARELAELKQQYGTVAEVAKKKGMSPSSISRYIALLKLPSDVQDQVAAGELPVAQPLKAKRKRESNKGPKLSALNAHHRAVLDTVARVTFATQQQIAQYTGRSLNTIRPAINDLCEARFLEPHKELRPYVYRLSSHGSTITGKPKPRHWMSANAIHQRILRNAIEINMQERNASATFVDRKQCWSMGLFPSVGEHLLNYRHEGKNQRALVIIDDYLMAPERILKSLTRLHDKEKSYASGHLVLAWKDVVDMVMVYTTDPHHAELHQGFVSQLLEFQHMPIVVRTIPAIWEGI